MECFHAYHDPLVVRNEAHRAFSRFEVQRAFTPSVKVRPLNLFIHLYTDYNLTGLWHAGCIVILSTRPHTLPPPVTTMELNVTGYTPSLLLPFLSTRQHKEEGSGPPRHALAFTLT